MIVTYGLFRLIPGFLFAGYLFTNVLDSISLDLDVKDAAPQRMPFRIHGFCF